MGETELTQDELENPQIIPNLLRYLRRLHTHWYGLYEPEQNIQMLKDELEEILALVRDPRNVISTSALAKLLWTLEVWTCDEGSATH